MTNDNNPFKSIEEKFLERQRAKKSTKRTKDTGYTQKHRLKLKKYVKLARYVNCYFCISRYLNCQSIYC